jgi:hypothetical protein
VTPEPFRCSVESLRRDDPMRGTAAPSSGMLLVEQPGAWGRQALVQSRLDPEIGLELSRRATALGLRVLLIRRPGRPRPRPGRRWALADSRPGRESIRWGIVGEAEELLELPLDGSAGEESAEPCYLVCTHGRHDTCCAMRGRPVAAALARARPGQVWECTHVGGDRFAANLVVLPHGLYYGRVDETTAVEVATAYERGEVVTALLRGRTTWGAVAQAAEHEMRTRLGIDRIESLRPTDVTAVGDGRFRVRLAHDSHDLEVMLEATSHGEPALLTCHARHEAHPQAYVVVNVTQLSS